MDSGILSFSVHDAHARCRSLYPVTICPCWLVIVNMLPAADWTNAVHRQVCLHLETVVGFAPHSALVVLWPAHAQLYWANMKVLC